MSPIDGPIRLNLKICNLDTTDVNISKVQPCEANCLRGVEPQRNKSPTILYKYRLKEIMEFEDILVSGAFLPVCARSCMNTY